MECVASVAKLRERHLELVPLGIAERTLDGIHRREGPRLVDTLALLVHHEARAALERIAMAVHQMTVTIEPHLAARRNPAKNTQREE